MFAGPTSRSRSRSPRSCDSSGTRSVLLLVRVLVHLASRDERRACSRLLARQGRGLLGARAVGRAGFEAGHVGARSLRQSRGTRADESQSLLVLGATHRGQPGQATTAFLSREVDLGATTLGAGVAP